MNTLPLLGRILFALLFVMTGFNHLFGGGAEYAAAAGVPIARVMVPFAGLLSLIGGLSIAVGYKARYGAWLLVLFLVPVTFAMHPFWAQADPMQQQLHMAMFMKNIALIGTALFIAYAGAGPLSLDARLAKA